MFTYIETFAYNEHLFDLQPFVISKLPNELYTSVGLEIETLCYNIYVMCVYIFVILCNYINVLIHLRHDL